MSFAQNALDTRPDLKAAVQAVDKAKTDHRLAVANGSTDPTFGVDVGRNPPIDQYIGVQREHSRCEFSTGIRAKSTARNWTSTATRSCWTRRKRRCSATWIRPMPW